MIGFHLFRDSGHCINGSIIFVPLYFISLARLLGPTVTIHAWKMGLRERDRMRHFRPPSVPIWAYRRGEGAKEHFVDVSGEFSTALHGRFTRSSPVFHMMTARPSCCFGR